MRGGPSGGLSRNQPRVLSPPYFGFAAAEELTVPVAAAAVFDCRCGRCCIGAEVITAVGRRSATIDGGTDSVSFVGELIQM